MYYLLERQSKSPRPVTAVLVNATAADLQRFLPDDDSKWALDLETTGTRAQSDRIVGIGLANAQHVLYVDLPSATPEAVAYLKKVLSQYRLIIFNAMFDATFLQVWIGQWPNVWLDAYALFKQLSSEGYTGQRWNLQTLQQDVLGWPESNKTVLEAALKEYGLSKAHMAKLPPAILGPYSGGDADAAWQGGHYLWGVTARFPELRDYHQRVFLTEVRLLAEQQLRGLWVDRDRLENCRADLERNIAASLAAFHEHPEVTPHITAFNEQVRQAWLQAEPPKHTKKGDVSVRWEQWRARERPWMEQRGFNANSKQQLCDLFYNKLGYKPRKFTETGRAQINKKVLPTLGEPGKLLATYNKQVKALGYVNGMIAQLGPDDIFHPQFNSVGAVTWRLSGSGGLSLHQQPKTPDYLWALRARPGMKLVQADAEALEPVILAEFSQDKTLLQLYGPGAKQNDVYLFVGSKIPALGRDILRAGYNPDDPTPDGIKSAKKQCKHQRAIAKKFHLMSVYLAGPEAIHSDLQLEGIDITLGEVKQMHKDYWRLFAGVKQWEMQLLEMRYNNDGWFPSILGTPLTIDSHPKILKDIVNRHTQHAGHTFLQVWLWHVDQLRRERGVTMHPWLADFHDEMLWEVPEEQAQAAADLISEALRRTNDEMGMGIQVKGPPMVVDNLAQVKCENYDEWLAARDA